MYNVTTIRNKNTIYTVSETTRKCTEPWCNLYYIDGVRHSTQCNITFGIIHESRFYYHIFLFIFFFFTNRLKIQRFDFIANKSKMYFRPRVLLGQYIRAPTVRLIFQKTVGFLIRSKRHISTPKELSLLFLWIQFYE